MHAQLIGAIAQLEQSITMQLFVMTRILALTNLAILKLDVSSLMLEHRTAMTTISAQLMDAPLILNNASTLLLTVTITILALLILAIQYLDANIHLCLLPNLMTTTHAQQMFVTFKMEFNIFQSFVIMETNAPLVLATLLMDANTVKKFAMTTTFAQLILALMDNVSSLLLFANKKAVKPLLAMQTLENASTLLSM
jgi:hypothetical protein